MALYPYQSITRTSVARSSVGDGLVGRANPRLRAARVHKHHNTLISRIGHDGVDLVVGYQAVGAQCKDHDLAGKVLLEIALKCRAARIKLAALFGIDMAVREHAVKGINGAQRHGVTDHQQVVGAIGEAVVVLVGVVGRLLVCGRGVFGFLVEASAPSPLSAEVSGTKIRPPSATTNTTAQAAQTGTCARTQVGGRGGAVAELGYGAPKGALSKRRLDKAI